MEHVVRPCDRIRPASVCIEVGCHEFDLSRVRRNLADGRAHFLAPTELPDGRATASPTCLSAAVVSLPTSVFHACALYIVRLRDFPLVSKDGSGRFGERPKT